MRSPDSSVSDVALRAVDTLLSYTYVRESGYNRSPEIDRFNRTAGAPARSSWCMSFTFSGFAFASAAMRVRNPLTRTASVSRQLRYAALIGSGLSVVSTKPIGGSRPTILRGDILCAKRGGGSDRDIGRFWLGHVETALADDDEYVLTVGGNTSSGNRGSQRDGDGVFTRRRKKSFFLAIIRVPSDWSRRNRITS